MLASSLNIIKGGEFITMFNSYSKLAQLAMDKRVPGDDEDSLTDKITFSLREQPELRHEIAHDYFEENRKKEPWVHGKNGEPEFEGGSFEEVARKTELLVAEVKKRAVDFLDKDLHYEDLSEYWQEKFLEEAIEMIVFHTIDAPYDN